MRKIRLGLVLVVILLAGGLDSRVAAGGDEAVFEEDFEDAAGGPVWEAMDQPGASLIRDPSGSRCLFIERPATQTKGNLTVRARLPLDRVKGSRVRVEAMVRAEDVALPPEPWNGIECMLHTVSPAGQNWQQKNGVYGSFDWKPIRFISEVPVDATEAWLVLGLELTTGRVWFDDVKIAPIGRRRGSPTKEPTGPVYKGHDLPRLRGAMIGPNVSEDDLRVLGGQWKANHVRWQLIWGGFPHGPADKADVEEYGRWLESVLSRLDGLLPVCEELGIHVLIDVHTPPGGRNQDKECRIFKEPRFQDAFVQNWEKIARRYRGNKTIWGYDLVNEPVEGIVAEGLMDWRTLCEVTAKKIRAIDTDHAIVIEPAPWGSPPSLDWFDPLDVPGIVYSVHMYQPHQFTHQGIYGNPTGVQYPGEVGGKHWDKDQLRRALQPAIDFQRDYGVQIYLGEFSAIRWAPGDSAANYLRDCIEIFEENDWDWAYHAFREWDGWSAEHGSDREDRSPSRTPTKREEVLRGWYSKNVRTR
jgi:hypothetical protein